MPFIGAHLTSSSSLLSLLHLYGLDTAGPRLAAAPRRPPPPRPCATTSSRPAAAINAVRAATSPRLAMAPRRRFEPYPPHAAADPRPAPRRDPSPPVRVAPCGEPLERPELEAAAAATLRACRPNAALTMREVKEDVHRVVESVLFRSCMPVAVDSHDGIRLVFEDRGP